MPDRAALTGILFVLRAGIQWEMLPLEMGCGSGITSWRRLREWQEAGVWDGLHRDCCVGCARPTGSTGAGRAWTAHRWSPKGGGDKTGPNSTDRGRLSTKRHLVTDRNGTPLAFVLTGAITNDSMLFGELLDGIPPVGGKTGRPRRRPDKLHVDKAYDHRRYRQAWRLRDIASHIARRGVETSQTLGRHRWVIERTFAWIDRFRRLVTRYERRSDIHRALTALACSLLCFNKL